MFRLIGRELGAECWLLTPTGRLPAVTEVTGLAGGTEEYSLFGVGGEPRITSWFLACAGREQGWPHELRESVAELAADVALERARLDASRTGDRKLAEAIITMLASGRAEGAAPVEIASLMRAVGLPPDGRYLVAAMCARADRADRVAGQDTDRWRYEAARGGSPSCAQRRRSRS
jgi:hypothetical protein